MDRSKIVAIITGAISVILAVAYLLLVMLLDFRGEMVPAPQTQAPSSNQFTEVAEQLPLVSNPHFRTSFAETIDQP